MSIDSINYSKMQSLIDNYAVIKTKTFSYITRKFPLYFIYNAFTCPGMNLTGPPQRKLIGRGNWVTIF